MAKEYSNESIHSQTDLEAARMYPNVYLGSKDIGGSTQTIHEILSNSVDEAKSGHGSKIEIIIHRDNSVTIKDEGRGIPVDFNKAENQYNWYLVFCKLHAGGKLKGNRDAYKASAGQHGIGAGVTQLTSEWFKCESRRDGYIYSVEFKKGKPLTDNYDKVLKKEKDPKGKQQKTGTIISWRPDEDDVFIDINYDLEGLKEWVRTQAITTDNVEFILKDERNNFKESYKYENGIKTYAEELVDKDGTSQLIEISKKGSGKDNAKQPSYEVNAHVIFAFTQNKEHSSWFHNSVPLALGGSPKLAMQKAFLEFFTKQLKAKGTLKKEGLEFDDIGSNLVYISNTETQDPPNYRNQTKDSIDNPFIEQFLIGCITNALQEWAKNSPLEIDKVSSQIAVNQESRLTSASVKQLTKEKLSGKIKLSAKIDKFTECRSKDNTKTEIFICEGDSAAGSVIQARDSDFQAVFALRGKIANVLKMDLGKILDAPLLTNLLKVIGTGISMGDSKKKNQLGDFDINNRRFDKYIFATDQDVDGLHIVCLGLTVFYKLMPELIKQGKVYVLDTPLFVLNLKDGKKVYAFSDNENAKLQKEYKDKIKSIDRKKGLGEWKPVDFAYFLDPDTRHLTQVTIEDAKLAQQNLELMMAEDSDARKEYIKKHAEEYENVELD